MSFFKLYFIDYLRLMPLDSVRLRTGERCCQSLFTTWAAMSSGAHSRPAQQSGCCLVSSACTLFFWRKLLSHWTRPSCKRPGSSCPLSEQWKNLSRLRSGSNPRQKRRLRCLSLGNFIRVFGMPEWSARNSRCLWFKLSRCWYQWKSSWNTFEDEWYFS